MRNVTYGDGDVIVGENESGVNAGKFTVRHLDVVLDRWVVQVADIWKFRTLAQIWEQAHKVFKTGRTIFVFPKN